MFLVLLLGIQASHVALSPVGCAKHPTTIIHCNGAILSNRELFTISHRSTLICTGFAFVSALDTVVVLEHGAIGSTCVADGGAKIAYVFGKL